jgi:peptidyl-prolyl cis-trans isomerase A (cyclophilin A)
VFKLSPQNMGALPNVLVASLLLHPGVAKPLMRAPDNFIVDFQTDVGSGANMSVNITRSLAPLGVDHFYSLVDDGFYNQAAFFRVVPNFVVQFGIAGTPAENEKWTSPIRDDPVKVSNLAGTLVYATAGPNTRTTQLFINYADNQGLDKQGFAPFGQLDAEGLAVAQRIFNPTPSSSSGVNQGAYTAKGNSWIKETYPGINFITKATVR